MAKVYIQVVHKETQPGEDCNTDEYRFSVSARDVIIFRIMIESFIKALEVRDEST